MKKLLSLLSLALAVTTASTLLARPIRGASAALGNSCGGSSLPITEVAYLEADGNSYIDTGIFGSTDFNYSVVFSVEESANFIFGCWSTANRRQDLFVFVNNYLVYGANGSNGNQPIANIEPSVVYEVTQVDGKITINGRSRTFTDTADFDRTWFLFGCNRGSIIHKSLAGTRIYSATIYLGDSLIADFSPVRFVNSRGETEGGMLDKVSGIVFTNDGSGSFLIGPDKE